MTPKWERKRFDRLATRLRRPVKPGDGVVTAFRDGQVTLRTNRRTDGFTVAFQEIGYQGVKTGDLVVHAMDAFAGAIGVSDSDGKASPVVHVYRTDGAADARFLAYCLRDMARSGYIQSLAKGIRERSTAFDPATLKYVELEVPDRPRQAAIANYLDRETAQIDALIEKQDSLIDRLQERRNAVISEAVVGGRAPSSGGGKTLDDQLARLPSDWNRVRLSRLVAAPVTAGVDYSAGPLEPGGLRYLRTTDIAGLTTLTPASQAVGVTVEQAGTALVKSGDVLLTRSGSLGTSYFHQSDVTMAYAGYLVRVRLDPARCDPSFLAWWTASADHLDQIKVGATRSTIDNFSASKFAGMRVPLPPISVQREIADHLTRETAKIDALTVRARRFIELARERRSALITAAVTGQIDVAEKEVA